VTVQDTEAGTEKEVSRDLLHWKLANWLLAWI